jgi:hypothetical protein
MADLHTKQLNDKKKLQDAIDSAFSAVSSAAKNALVAAVPSLAILSTAFDDLTAIVTAYRNVRVVCEVLGSNCKITGRFTGGKSTTVTVNNVAAAAAAAPSNVFSATCKHTFQQSPTTMAKIDTDIAVTVRID